jgi:long-chain acyl-CoA synthetase
MASKNLNTVAGFEDAVRRFGASRALGQEDRGEWQWTSYRELGEQVDRVRGGLASLGVSRGDRVALVSDNRIEWAVISFAAHGLGAALVPIGQAQGLEEQRFIIRDSGAKVVACATDDLYERLAASTGEIPTLEQRIGLALPSSHPGSFRRLLEIGATKPAPVIDLRPEDTATILYTSGTTAAPKGVMLSHRSVVSNVIALSRAVSITSADVSLSVLPWSLSFGHTCELQTMLRLGARIALVSSVDKLLPQLGEVQPSVLVAVPQMLQLVYDHLHQAIRSKPGMIRALFETGLELQRKQRERELGFADRLKLEAAERTVLGPLRQRLGGNLRYIFCGGATLSMEIAQYLTDVGLPVYEGYGLTEAGPVVTLNRPGTVRLGTVGKPLPGVEVEIDTSRGAADEQGEIVVRSPGVMSGYHGEEALDGSVLRTGDLGFLDSDGFLHITGRLDDEYKLDNGKHVVPSRLERELRLSRYVRAAVVYGEGRPHNVALVVVDVDALSRWAEDRDLHFPDTAAMLASPRVKSHIMAEIGERSGGFRGYERIRDALLVTENLNADGGMLSAAQKLRRGAMLDKYGDELARLYER